MKSYRLLATPIFLNEVPPGPGPNEASLVQYKYSQQILCTGGIHIRKDKTIQRMERRRIRHG
jgi:hypothetical protein